MVRAEVELRALRPHLAVREAPSHATISIRIRHVRAEPVRAIREVALDGGEVLSGEAGSVLGVLELELAERGVATRARLRAFELTEATSSVNLRGQVGTSSSVEPCFHSSAQHMPDCHRQCGARRAR